MLVITKTSSVTFLNSLAQTTHLSFHVRTFRLFSFSEL